MVALAYSSRVYRNIPKNGFNSGKNTGIKCYNCGSRQSGDTNILLVLMGGVMSTNVTNAAHGYTDQMCNWDNSDLIYSR